MSTMFHTCAKHTLMQINIYMFEFKIYQDNMFVCFIPTYTPLLYSKTGVYRGIHYFLIFALKHILWELARTASNMAVLTCTHNIGFEKIMKIIIKIN